MDDFFMLVAVVLFISAIGFIVFALYAWTHQKKSLENQMKNKVMEEKSVEEILSMLPKEHCFPTMMFNVLSMGAAFVLIVVMMEWGIQSPFAYGAGLVFYVAIRIVHALKKDKIKQKLYEKLPAVSDMILYHNRIGTPVHLIIDFLEKNAHPPLKQFFVLSNQKIRAGMLPYKALLQTAKQYRMLELDLLALVLSLQNRQGFSTQSAFLFLSKHWRNQLILKKKIRSILAENRMTLLVLAAMPFVVSGFNYVRDPVEFQQLFTTQTGRMVFGFGVGLYCIGIIAFYCLSRIE